jgi:type IV secretion system protein VirB4
MYISDLLKKQPSIEEKIPQYHYHVSERIVSFSENKLMFALKLNGMPFESTDATVLEAFSNGLNRFFSSLAKSKGGRLAIWTQLLRSRVDFSDEFKFNNLFMKGFGEKYLNRFHHEDYFENSFYISFILKYDEFSDGLAEIEDLAIFVAKALSSYGADFLTLYEKNGVLFSGVYKYLGILLNGVEEEVPVTARPAFEIIPSSWLHFAYDLLEIRAESSRRYACCYDLKDFPDTSSVGMFDGILTLPFEFSLTQSFICMGPYEAQREIDEQINKLRSVGDQSGFQMDELKEAKGRLSAGEIVFGEYHGALIVFGDSEKNALDHGASAVSSFLSQSGARWVKAMLSAPMTYLSQLPGFHHRPRPMPKSSRNIAGAFCMHNYSTGKQKGNPIGDGTALMPLQTRSKSVYHFNFHYSKLDEDNLGEKVAGHTLMLGATGTGKTTTQSTMIGFLERFSPKIFAIDKDRGMEIFIRQLGGAYFPLKAGEPTGLNPFQLEDTPRNRDFLYGLVTACGLDSDGKISAEEEQQLKIAIDTNFSLPFLERRFSRLLESIPHFGGNCLSERLRKWCYAGDGRFAWALDNPRNDFDVSQFNRIGFDVTDFLRTGFAPTEPVLSYLFHLKDMMQAGGGLLATIVEEFWLPAQYKTTQAQIMDVLKTGRKRDEFILLVSQSPEDALNSPIFDAIVQQTPTKVFLPNPNAEFESYRKCGLTQSEFNELKDLSVDSRTFLIKQGNQSAFALLDLYGFNDEMSIISGSTENIAIMESAIQEVGSDPDLWLPKFHQIRKEAREGKVGWQVMGSK